MKIYTRTGDDGDTGLFGGGRVPKDHPRVAAYGDVDELNSSLGVARATAPAQLFDALLESVQRDLFAIGGHLATPDPDKVAQGAGEGGAVGGADGGVRAADGRGRRGAAAAPRLRAARRHAEGRGAAPRAHGLPPGRAQRRPARPRGARSPSSSSSTSTGSPTCSSRSPAWPITGTARAT